MADNSLLTEEDFLTLERDALTTGLRYSPTYGVLRGGGPVRLIGCGQAGTNLAAVFRTCPDWIQAYSRDWYPVNAITMDSQGSDRAIPNDTSFSWDENLENRLFRSQRKGTLRDRVVTHFPLVIPSDPGGRMSPDLLSDYLRENASVREGGIGEIEPLTEVLQRFWQGNMFGLGSGGAGGKALEGRAAALWSLTEREEWVKEAGAEASTSYRSLMELALTSDQGYTLLTLTSIDGGTGSGASGVVNSFIDRYTNPPHPLLRLTVGVMSTEGSDNSDERRANRLISLYYLLNNPRDTDGVILVDNSLIRTQNLLMNHDAENVYLHKILMPVFLAQLPRYNVTVSEQLDAKNIQNLLRTGGGNVTGGDAPELVVACYDEDTRGDDLDIEKMIKNALLNPTVRIKQKSGRRVLCVLSGPFTQSVISRNQDELNKFTTGEVSNILESEIRDNDYSQWRCRAFVANFEKMKGFRLTLLISGCHVPEFEDDLMNLAKDTSTIEYWDIPENQRLAEALRRLDESDVRMLG